VAWIPATTAKAVVDLFAMFAGLYVGSMSSWGWALFALYLAGVGVAIAYTSQSERPAVVYLLLSVLLPVVIALVVSIFKPLFLARYLLICLPFFALLVARGIIRIESRSIAAAITILIVILSLSQDRAFYYDASIEDWRGAIDYIARNARDGDVLVVFPRWNVHPAEYYVESLEPPRDLMVIATTFPPPERNGDHVGEKVDNLRKYLRANRIGYCPRAWIITDQADQNAPALRAMEAGHQTIAGPQLAGLKVDLIELSSN
jgi:hypothetical protein